MAAGRGSKTATVPERSECRGTVSYFCNPRNSSLSPDTRFARVPAGPLKAGQRNFLLREITPGRAFQRVRRRCRRKSTELCRPSLANKPTADHDGGRYATRGTADKQQQAIPSFRKTESCE